MHLNRRDLLHPGTTVHPFGRKILTLPLAEKKLQRSPGLRKVEAVRKKGEIDIFFGCWIDAGQIMNTVGNAR